MQLQNIIRSSLVIACFMFTTAANAVLIDFTSAEWGAAINDGDGTSATVGNVTLSSSNGSLTFNYGESELAGCDAGSASHSLACAGDGIGINNDEISESGDEFTSSDQTITISFATAVDVTNIFLLDLFGNEYSPSHNESSDDDESDSSSHNESSDDDESDSSSHNESSDDDDSDSSSNSHDDDDDSNDSDHEENSDDDDKGEIAVIDGLLFGPPSDNLDNLGGYYATGFSKWGALAIVLSGNADDFSDYSLAGIEFSEVSAVPLPGALILFGSALLGLFGFKRFS